MTEQKVDYDDYLRRAYIAGYVANVANNPVPMPVKNNQNDDDDQQSQPTADDSSQTTYKRPSVPPKPCEEEEEEDDHDISIDPDHDEFNDVKYEEKKTPPPRHSGVRVRCWYATIFRDEWSFDFSTVPLVTYAVYTKEICPTTKRIHYHLYIELSDGRDANWVRNNIGLPVEYLRIRLGTVKQMIAYCTKKRTRFPDFYPVHFGVPKDQGYRTDLDNLADAIINGASYHELLIAGRGNTLRYGNMIRIATEAVHGENTMDNIILARRAARARGLPIPFASQIKKDEFGNMRRFEEYMAGAHSSDNPELQALLDMIKAGSGEAPECRSGKKLRKEYKEAKAESVKKYAKPCGAMLGKNIIPFFRSQIVEFNSKWVVPKGTSDFRVEKYARDFGEFFNDIVLSVCKFPEDAVGLKDKVSSMFMEERANYIQHIRTL